MLPQGPGFKHQAIVNQLFEQLLVVYQSIADDLKSKYHLGLIYLHFKLIFHSRPVIAVSVFFAIKWQQPVCHNRCLPSLIVSSSHVITHL